MFQFKVNQAQLNRITSDLEKHVLKETNDMAQELYNGIRNDTPVASGRAQRGWQLVPAERIGEAAQVGNDVEYVKYLEFGTNTQPAQRFIQRNIKESLAKRGSR